MSQMDLAERLAAIVKTQEEVASLRPQKSEIMRLVADRASELTGADGAVVEIVRKDEIHYHTATGSLAAHAGTLFDVEGSLSGLCVTTGQALRCDDALTDPRVNREIAEATGTRSMVVVPLLHQDRPVGVLKVASSRPAAFQDLDAWSLQMMAGLIAAAMQHADDYDAKTRSEARFRLLFDRNLAGAFRSTTEGKILEVNDALATLLGFDSKEELTREESWNLYPKRSDREALLATLERERSITNQPLRLKRKDGTLIDTVTNMDLLPGEGEVYLLGTLLEKDR